MTDKKISELNTIASPAATDLLILNDVSESPDVTGTATATAVWAAAKTAATDSATGVVELATAAETLTGTDTERAVTPDGLFSGITWKKSGTIVDPQTVYSKRAQLPIFRADAALTITRIHIACNDYSPGAELAGDLKWADDINDGSFANAAVIDVCDTTNGVFTVTAGMDDATIPSGKYVYYSFDASPHADIDEIFIEVYFTYD